jgi:uncharacterized Zn finger protein (UPF0148 family)
MASVAVAKRVTAIARPLKVLIPLIQSDLEQGDRAGMTYYADAGDKLLEAKSQVAHGHWGAWLRKNFTLSDKTAQTYMRAASIRVNNQNRSGASVLPPSLREMVGATDRARVKRKTENSFRSVLRELEADLYTQEKQTRDDEIELHRDMALELIDIGFKALATRLHPDRGGSKDAMARLNRVRDELKQVAKQRRYV